MQYFLFSANILCMTISIILLQRKHGIKLLFTDIDSLAYGINTDDVYEDFHKNKRFFGLSNYPEDSKFFRFVNEKVYGKMKDESERKINDEFVGLKSKMQSIKGVYVKEKKAGQEVNKNVLENIKHGEYIDVLLNK